MHLLKSTLLLPLIEASSSRQPLVFLLYISISSRLHTLPKITRTALSNTQFSVSVPFFKRVDGALLHIVVSIDSFYHYLSNGSLSFSLQWSSYIERNFSGPSRGRSGREWMAPCFAHWILFSTFWASSNEF